MPGQPQIPGWLVFDVTEIQAAEPGLAPVNIVRRDTDFNLTATFTGTGALWDFLEALSDLPVVQVVGMVTFSVEGIGSNAIELDFGPALAVLTVGGTYNVTTTITANSLSVGVYTVACYVSFEVRVGGSIVPIPALTGYMTGIGVNEDDLSVY